MISLTEFFSNTNPIWPLIVVFSNSSRVVWTDLYKGAALKKKTVIRKINFDHIAAVIKHKDNNYIYF